jgi:signal peptidase I
LALLIALVVRGVGLEAFKIPSASMLPTLQIGDYLLVNKLRYGIRIPGSRRWAVRFGSPEPGDVIVFSDPKDQSVNYVKRVIAVENEVVEIRDKDVLVNGVRREVPTAYFANQTFVQPSGRRDNIGPLMVPRGRVFVLGDNRDHSFDSRYRGFVKTIDVEGKALLVYWSADGDEGAVRWDRIGKVIP